MTKRSLACLLFVLFTAVSALAQKTTVNGRVTDSETGEPIPYVNIGFQRSLVGTISENDGSFYL
jgi:hypothetical protein